MGDNSTQLLQLTDGTENKIKLVETDRVISVNYVIRNKTKAENIDVYKDLNQIITNCNLIPFCITGVTEAKTIKTFGFTETVINGINNNNLTEGDLNSIHTDINVTVLGGLNKRKNTPSKRTRKNTRRYRR